MSPSLSFGFHEGAVAKYKEENQHVDHGDPKMFGVDTGNPERDYEASVWLMAILGTLAAAVPVALIAPNLGFKKRSLEDFRSSETVQQIQNNFMAALNSAKKSYKDL